MCKFCISIKGHHNKHEETVPTNNVNEIQITTENPRHVVGYCKLILLTVEYVQIFLYLQHMGLMELEIILLLRIYN